MTKHTSSKEKIEEAIRLLDKLQDDREGFPTDWTGIRNSRNQKNLRILKFTCLICKEKFDNVLSLRKHMKEHLNDSK